MGDDMAGEGGSSAAARQQLLHDDLMAEYYRIAEIVTSFDQRLLTIKSWGVTFGLATLTLGFQQDHYGLFLVAAASGLAFWLVEASTKVHQMRYYPRMAEIEVIADELFGEQTAGGRVSSPLINWSWHTAWPPPHAGELAPASPPAPGRPAGAPAQTTARWHPVFFPHVALPHAITVVLGAALFGWGLAGALGPI